jgi:V/A-type H+-transporting ATPase subunit C
MTGYDYGNARLRARRAALLRPEQYASLASRDLPGLLTALAATCYKPQADATADPRDGPLCQVERLVRDHLTAALGDVAGFYHDQARVVVIAVLGRFDVQNVLTLLRAAHHGGAAEVSAALVPVGRLSTRTAREAAAQPDLPAAARLLAGRGLPDPGSASALREAARRYEVHASLALAEHAVARAGRASQLQTLTDSGAAAEPVTAALHRETNDQNLMLALRLREAGDRPGIGRGAGHGGGQFLPGGTVPDGQLAAIQGAPTRTGAATAAAAVSRWRPALSAWADGGDVARLHAEVETERLRAELRLLRGADPLGPAAVLQHVLAHQVQARNIRLLTRAAAGDISHDNARRQLVEPV